MEDQPMSDERLEQSTRPETETGKIPTMQRDPFPHYRTMRESCPIHFNEQIRWWEVFDFEDVQRVLTDYTLFSTGSLMEDTHDEDRPIRNIVYTDPPQHTRLRRLISQLLNEESVLQWEPRISQLAYELLEPLLAREQVDIVKEFSYPYPIHVISDIYGIPVAEREHFYQLVDAFLQVLQSVNPEPLKELTRYFKDLIVRFRREPGEGLVNDMLRVELDGEHFTDAEVVSMCVVLVNAGCKSISNTISSAILCFDSYPEALEELYRDPALLPGAIEEVLRYISPVQMLPRAVCADTVLNRETIREGAIVAAWIGSGNRDEAKFPRAELFDIRRSPNPHIAFGDGIHLCVGAPLARLEVKVALETILKHFADIKRVREAPIELFESPYIYGVTSLPITFRAR